MKRYKLMATCLVFSVMIIGSGSILAGCSKSDVNDAKTTETTGYNSQDEDNAISMTAEFDIDTSINEEYIDESYDENATKVKLTETYTITNSGTYILSGDIKDGQIVVNNTDSDKVKLVFDGVNVSCSDGPAVNVIQGKTIITLAEGSKNVLSDGTSYDSAEESACIYSCDDLCINGLGSLEVTANYKTGIQSKDDLRIINGNITVNAIGDGIKGKDSLVIKDGTVNITAGKDGIQATNIEAEKGYVLILGGDVVISCVSDAIKAETIVEINGGNINIEKSEEGIEAIYIRINGGDIKLCATDDGINASNGSDTDAGGEFVGGNRGGKFGGNDTQSQESSVIPVLYINGGNVYVNAGGDGLDSNGALYINSGNVKVDGPTNSGNGFFDYVTAFEIKGGELIGCGSSGMMETPDASSTQNVIVVTGINGATGDAFIIKDSNGNEIVTYEPSKTFQAVVYSSDNIKTEESYTAYINDTEIGNVTISGIVSYIGDAGEGMQGGFGGKDFNRGNRNQQEMPTGADGQVPPEMPTGEDGQRPEIPTGADGQVPPDIPSGFGGEQEKMPFENESGASV